MMNNIIRGVKSKSTFAAMLQTSLVSEKTDDIWF